MSIVVRSVEKHIYVRDVSIAWEVSILEIIVSLICSGRLMI